MSEDYGKLRSAVKAISLEVQRLNGQVTAIESALLSAVSTHHNLDALSASLQEGFERIEAIFLGGSKSEIGLTAFQEGRARVDAVVNQAIADRGADAG